MKYTYSFIVSLTIFLSDSDNLVLTFVPNACAFCSIILYISFVALVLASVLAILLSAYYISVVKLKIAYWSAVIEISVSLRLVFFRSNLMDCSVSCTDFSLIPNLFSICYLVLFIVLFSSSYISVFFSVLTLVPIF